MTPPPDESTQPPERQCSHCGSPLADGQDWCLECGAATPGALRSRGPARAGGVLLALTGILVATAAGAAYAALRTPARHVVLQAGPVTTSALVPGAGGATGPSGATGAAALPTTGTALVPAVTPPKTATPAIPKVTAAVTPATTTPPPAVTTPPPAVVTPPASTTTSHSTSTTQTASAPQPLLLDPTATSDYNPNGFPPSNFGDPTLAIDGDPTTSWSAQVPTLPPAGGSAGLLIDLRTAQSLASLKLVTDTPGNTFAILGANGSKAPSTIGDPGWTRLAAPHSVKHAQTFTLATKGHSYRWLVVWILGVKGGPVATLPATVATAATASTSTATAATTAGASSATGATSGTSTTSQSTTTSSATSNTSPLVNVDVSELSST